MYDEADLIPLRGVNAYAFCPRLFWLEYVAQEFEHNQHTVEGKHIHRRVDRPGGSMEPPDDGDDPWHTRSVWLSDDEHGVTGKIDLVEADEDGEVMPVQTKKGGPFGDGELWRDHRIQLTLELLLLRNQGYEGDRIAAYYDGTRRRVVETVDEDTIDEALAAVEGAREVYARDLAPDPLVDSRKCTGCSLNAICMPDEVNAMRALEAAEDSDGDGDGDEGGAAEIRRVLVPRENAVPLYVSTPGARIGKSKSSLKIKPPKYKEDAEVRSVGIHKISELNLMGGVQITTQALQTLLRNEIPVGFYSYGGWFYGTARSTRNRNVGVRIAQFDAHETERGLELGRVLVADKIHNSRVLLRRNAERDQVDDDLSRMMRLREKANSAEDAATLLGYEGEAARRYWSAYSDMLAGHDEMFEMNGRNRRPPEDPTNAMLSFGYAILVKDCVRAAERVGLDPFLGMYHTTHHGRPSMALDLMEPFRPLIVDSTVLQLVRRNELTNSNFVFSGQAVTLSKKGRKTFIKAYERRMNREVTHPVFGYEISYRRTLSVHARLIARALTGELDHFPSFRTR